MLLQNDKILLRAIEPEDLDHLYKWENDSRLWIHGSSLAPYSRYTLQQYIEDVQQYDIFQSNQLRMIICLQDDKRTIVGAVDIYDLDAHSRRAAVGVVVDESYRQQGLGQEALSLLEEYAFRFLNLHQLYAYISVENKISIELFSKMGYQIAGTMKDWIYTMDGHEDVVLVQLMNKKDE